MKKSSGFQRGGKLTEGQKRLLPVVLIPLVVIILMAVIVMHDRGKQEHASAAAETTAKETMTETAAQEPTESADTEAEAETTAAETQAQLETLQKDGIPEICDLMNTYFQARATADAETMNRLYGIGEVGVVTLEEQKTRMRSNSKYVQGFENITTYVKDGMSADSWLVYTTADIRFHSVKTAAPMIMWCYVVKDSEGNYLLQDHTALDPQILTFIDAANRSEEVRRLASGVNVALKEALLNDADLNEVYGVLREGSPVWKDGEQQTDAVEILTDETEAGAAGESTESSAAESAEAETAGSAEAEASGSAGATDSTEAETETGAAQEAQ